jgi:hypothetical protein
MSEKATYEESPKALEESPIAPATNTARTSIDTIADSEAARENARNSNPNGFVRTTSGVDVKAAEAEFADLQRELSGISQMSRRLSRTQSRQKKGVAEKDVEKTASSDSATDGEQFDLEHTLRGNHTVSILWKIFLGIVKLGQDEKIFWFWLSNILREPQFLCIQLTFYRQSRNPAFDQNTSG